METIYIPHLLTKLERKEVIDFEEFIPDLETLTPVRGRLQVAHQGNYLEVKAKAETIVTLTCHRCLKQYNHRLKLRSSEIIWLEEKNLQPDASSGEYEVDLEDLVENLPPTGSFSPSDWVYQQMCLELPHKHLCDTECPGIDINDDDDAAAETESSETLSDSRWASLAALKRKLP
ncbi:MULTISPECIES: YceD family protein [unclassified Microcoleus]|uniref:YceD family protein n=1 Tax=unclassified Microcoleus TaxID=2642155 RepID=UPI002FD34882